MTYPPEPWHLRGQMYVSVWSLPRAQLPPLPPELAAAVRPLTVAGRGFVGATWVDYGPGGVMEYRELLCAVLVRSAHRPQVSIVDIWVDSPASRDGGRELWGIPKELADLDFHTPDRRAVETRASTAGAAIAQARISVGARLPWRWPTRFSVTQVLNGRIKTTPVRARAGVRLAKARWEVAPDGPLAYLNGRRPLFTVALHDFRLVFGQTPAA